ncbi:MAG: hypothetical protein AMXMBFR61_16170 [Fimbriimonadales bacterium]
MTSRTVNVGMAEVKSYKGPVSYVCLGLGSCIAVCLLDPVANVSVVAHIMLPRSFSGKPTEEPGKFADTAVPEIKRQLEALGGRVADAAVAYAGGAQVFQLGSGDKNRLDIGTRNSEAVREALTQHGFRIVAADVGGASGRSLVFESGTGSVRIRSFTQGEAELCNLRSQALRAA